MKHHDKVVLDELLARLPAGERRQLQRRAVAERQRLRQRPVAQDRRRADELDDLDDEGGGDDGWQQRQRTTTRRPVPSIEEVMLDFLRTHGVTQGCASVSDVAGAGNAHVDAGIPWPGGRSDAPRCDESAPSLGGLQSVAQPGVAGVRATVIGIGPGVCRVRCGDTTGLHPLHPDLAQVQKTAVAVGDTVWLETSPEVAAGARVVAVDPRRSSLSRPDPHVRGVARVIAANVDVAVIVVALTEPPLRPGLIDRMLVAIGRGGVAPMIVVNKMDLVAPGDYRQALLAGVAPYGELGIPVVMVAARSGEGLADLRAALRGKTCVFIGHSGVGKSSLVNALEPSLAIKTNGLRRADLKGRHTTSSSALHELSDGIVVIDTPGVRVFGLTRQGPAELAEHFSEFAPFVGQCRFIDCTHRHEPDCAVKAAVAAGHIAAARYRSYRRLQGEDIDLDPAVGGAG